MTGDHRHDRRVPGRGPGAPVRYVKVLRPGKAERLASRVEAAWRAEASAPEQFPGFASIAECSGDAVAFAEIEGRTLHDLLMEGRGGRARARAAEALAAFQSVGVPDGLPAHRPGPASSEYLGHMARHFPELAPGYAAALEVLPQASPSRVVGGCPVHGDLHDRNVIVGGGRVWFLDLELLHAGDPSEDVGNLAAHLVLRALQRGGRAADGRDDVDRMLAAYRAGGGAADDDLVAAVGARTLFRLACLSRFRRRWQHVTPTILEESVRWATRGAA